MSNPMDDLSPVDTKPSPYVSPYLSRLQAEELERHLTVLPQKKWKPALKALRRALEHNANGKRYPWQDASADNLKHPESTT